MMDDEQELDDFDMDADMGTFDSEAAAGDAIVNVMGEMLEAASVDAVFGIPVEQGDFLVIPAAEVMAVAGFGLGSGGAEEASSKPGEETGYSSGSGGGGGGYSFSRPVAVIIAGPAGVRVEPVIDLTKIALAGITAAGFAIGMLAQMRRSMRMAGRRSR